jgi:hypothetical protein
LNDQPSHSERRRSDVIRLVVGGKFLKPLPRLEPRFDVGGIATFLGAWAVVLLDGPPDLPYQAPQHGTNLVAVAIDPGLAGIMLAGLAPGRTRHLFIRSVVSQ